MLLTRRILSRFFRLRNYSTAINPIISNSQNQRNNKRAQKVLNNNEFTVEVQRKVENYGFKVFGTRSKFLMQTFNTKGINIFCDMNQRMEFIKHLIVCMSTMEERMKQNVGNIMVVSDPSDIDYILEFSEMFYISTVVIESYSADELKSLLENKMINLLILKEDSFQKIFPIVDELIPQEDTVRIIFFDHKMLKLPNYPVKNKYICTLLTNNKNSDLVPLVSNWNEMNFENINMTMGDSNWQSLSYKGMCFETTDQILTLIHNIYKKHSNKSILVYYNEKTIPKAQLASYSVEHQLPHSFIYEKTPHVEQGIKYLDTKDENKVGVMNLHDVIIEIPFISYEHMVRRRIAFNKKNNTYHYYFAISHNQLEGLTSLIHNQGLDISIENLSRNEEDLQTQVENLVGDVEKIQGKSFLDLKPFNDFVWKREDLAKKIVELFFIQNKHLLLLGSKNVSLLTGKAGYITVLIDFIATKNSEDRFYIPKFLLKEKLHSVEKLHKAAIRVADTFSIVTDIPIERFDEIKMKSEKIGLSIEVLEKLPKLFYNPFAESFKQYKEEITKPKDVDKDIKEILDVLNRP